MIDTPPISFMHLLDLKKSMHNLNMTIYDHDWCWPDAKVYSGSIMLDSQQAEPALMKMWRLRRLQKGKTNPTAGAVTAMATENSRPKSRPFWNTMAVCMLFVTYQMDFHWLLPKSKLVKE